MKRKTHRRMRTRKLLMGIEPLESRRVLTLPLTLTTATRVAVPYNGPTVDTVDQTAFISRGARAGFYFAPQFTGAYTLNAHELDVAVDPEMAVYDSRNGASIARNQDKSLFNDDAEITLNLTAGIRYIVAVADESGLVEGNINLKITGQAKTGTTLVPLNELGDAQVTSVLEKPTDIDYLEVIAPPDATGDLHIIASGINTMLGAFGPSGNLLGPTTRELNIGLVRPGEVYRIAVMSEVFSTAGTTNLIIDFEESGVTVTNTLDAGPGSLRQAILLTNASFNLQSVNRINFNIPGTAPFTIPLATSLPDITKAVQIAGLAGRISIDGSALTGAEDGLRVLANDVLVDGLNIHNFPGDGIEVQGQRAILLRNLIGTDPTGTIAMPNKGNGIVVQNSALSTLSDNLVSGNGLNGIMLVGDNADNNKLLRNVVGATRIGAASLPNGGNGIVIRDGDSNSISESVVSGNALSGIVLEGTAVQNTITNSKIGTNRDGLTAVPNLGDGVVIKSPRNTVGGAPGTPPLRNIISGNGKTGISLSGIGASSNVIEGNFVGTDRTCNTAIPNGSDGIRIFNAPRNRIGSAIDATAGNVISGNIGTGLSFTNAGSTGNLVLGNFIGIAFDGLTALGNRGSGVLLSSGATNVQIGGTNAISRNVIAANGSSGISISSTAHGNRVSRNLIGVNTAGSPRGNVNAGIAVQGADNTIGGVNATFANTIAGNPVGITLSGTSATNNVIAFNTIGSEAAALIGNGIQVSNAASTNTIGPKNTIRRNLTGIRVADGSREIRITQNAVSLNFNLGIDLLPTVGFSDNDVGDVDSGANQLQNFPTLTSDPILVGVDMELSFLVASSPLNSAYPLTVEFYSSDGDGEGAIFLGSTIYTEANQAVGVKTVTLAGASSGLTAGISRIVALAIDLRGNTSEFSRQRNLVSGALLSTAFAAQSLNPLDVNGDKRLDTADANLLAATIINSTARVDVQQKSAMNAPDIKLDVDQNGTIEMRDVLLVLRGIELNRLNWRRVAALNTAIQSNTWDESLLELLATDLRSI